MFEDMSRYLSTCSSDFEALRTEFSAFMDNPIRFFVDRSEEAKAFCVLVVTIELVGLLLGQSYFGKFIAVWIGLASLFFSAATALISQSLKDEIAALPFVQFFSNGSAKWKHVQFTISLILTSANFISIILQIALTTKYAIYLFTAIMTIILTVAYAVESLASLRIDDGSAEERTPVGDEAQRGIV